MKGYNDKMFARTLVPITTRSDYFHHYYATKKLNRRNFTRDDKISNYKNLYCL